MIEIQTPVKELEKVWRARCSQCGDHQLVTEDLKSKAKWILLNMLGWYRTVDGLWFCRNCKHGKEN